jgi:hypothetical protein
MFRADREPPTVVGDAVTDGHRDARQETGAWLEDDIWDGSRYTERYGNGMTGIVVRPDRCHLPLCAGVD